MSLICQKNKDYKEIKTLRYTLRNFFHFLHAIERNYICFRIKNSKNLFIFEIKDKGMADINIQLHRNSKYLPTKNVHTDNILSQFFK